MARTTRSAATERAYLHFARQGPQHGSVVVPTRPAAAADAGEDFDESDIWGAFAPSAAPAADPPRVPTPFLAARKAPAPDGTAAHGSLPVKIPDWSKILGSEYRPAGYHHYGGAAGDWEVDDADDEDSVDVLVPPHELVGRRRAASLNGVRGRTLKVRDAVWKRTTGFQD